MSAFLAMVVANLRMTIRNRQALFWNLAFPAIFILIFGAVFTSGNPLESIDVGVTDEEGSPLSAGVVDALRDIDGFTVHEGSLESEREELEQGARDVVIALPPVSEGEEIEIGLYYSSEGGPTSELPVGAVRSVLTEVVGASTGVSIENIPTDTSEFSYIDWFIPGILAMSLMNSGVIGMATAFVAYRERGILRRIRVTPFPLWKFTLARIVASLTIGLVTSGILIGLGTLVWGFQNQANLLLLVAVLILGGLTFFSIGFAIAAIARNTETAASYANLITFPMLFLSGVFFPIATLPVWLEPVVRIMPLRYLVDALREPMQYGHGLGTVWPQLTVLMAIFTVAVLFSIRFFRWDDTER